METRAQIARRMQNIREGHLLDAIRERTAMYIGERSLTALHHFLSGYSFATKVHEVPLSHPLPSDFQDWVAYRLHFRESTSGYRRMILQHYPDESSALDRFFELLDEHRTQCARVVATVRCHPDDPDVFRDEQGDMNNKRRLKVAEQVKIVTYTDDPGFFVTQDDQSAEYPSRKSRFLPALSWLRYPFQPDAEYVTVLDHDEYNRLCREDRIFKQRCREEVEEAKLRAKAAKKLDGSD